MFRACLVLCIVGIVAGPAMADQWTGGETGSGGVLIVSEDFTDGAVNATMLSASQIFPEQPDRPDPQIMSIDGVNVFGQSAEQQLAAADVPNSYWGQASFGYAIPAGQQTLRPGNVWVFKIGIYSNYWAASDADHDPLVQPTVWVDLMRDGNLSGTLATMRTLSGGVESQAIASDRYTFADGSFDAAHSPKTDTIYSADTSTLGYISNVTTILRPDCTGTKLQAAIKGSAGDPVEFINAVAGYAPSKITMPVFSVYNKVWHNSGGDPNIRMTDGTIINYQDADPGTLKAGLTSLTIAQVRQTDFNADYKVNIDDASIMIGPKWGSTSGATFFDGDANGDAKVNIDDASWLIGTDWGSTDYDEPAGYASFSVDGGGNIFIDAKGIALYQVFVGDANHEKVPTGGDLLTYDPNRSAPRNLSVWGALTNDFQVDPVGGNPEYFGAVNTAANTIGTATAVFAYDEDNNIIGILDWNSDGVYKDTYVNIDMAALQAAGLSLWMEYKTLGGTSQYQGLPIPEPATMALLALGGLTLAIRRRR